VVDALVDHAVIAEMLLEAAGGNDAADAQRAAQAAESDEYLGGRVRYEKDRLVDEAEEGVMMEWEAPLMEAHAGLLCGDGGDRDVVNVGFGMVRTCVCMYGRE
jgi:type IV protein arginine methyltransferase